MFFVCFLFLLLDGKLHLLFLVSKSSVQQACVPPKLKQKYNTSISTFCKGSCCGNLQHYVHTVFRVFHALFCCTLGNPLNENTAHNFTKEACKTFNFQLYSEKAINLANLEQFTAAHIWISTLQYMFIREMHLNAYSVYKKKCDHCWIFKGMNL